jgi:hypothetical protein
LAIVTTTATALADEPATANGPIALQQDDDSGQLRIVIDGREALVYQYGPQVDLVHYYPVRSPSGKLLTIQQTEPYPHHRSVWFADTVQLQGQRRVSFYSALNSRLDRQDPNSPFRDRVRHIEFLSRKADGNRAEVVSRLVWEMDQQVPVLDELRRLQLAHLGGGEYLMDLTFTLTAAHGDVTFVSDDVHYAWPYVRMHPQFSGTQGGTLINSAGGTGQAGTHNQPARWIDYFNTVDGVTEGLAIFSHPENTHPHRWLTREYGTFGPRRANERSGQPFVLADGQSLQQRVGILVHRGDVDSGQVAQRYQQYAAGDLFDDAAVR